METSVESVPVSKWAYWAGWVCSGLVIAGLLFSGVLKLLQMEEVLKEFSRLGWESKSVVMLGILELSCALIYTIPRTSVLGAILLTGYLGGAVATHFRITDSFIPPLVMGVMVWLGLYLRDRRIRALVPLKS